jgi:hypothetical protein
MLKLISVQILLFNADVYQFRFLFGGPPSPELRTKKRTGYWSLEASGKVVNLV